MGVANNTAGQIQIAGSDASTIINSPFSTGMQSEFNPFPAARSRLTRRVILVIVAKGVTSVGGTSNGQAAGTTNNWWTNLPLGAVRPRSLVHSARTDDLSSASESSSEESPSSSSSSS
jgi:hypothetical protein